MLGTAVELAIPAIAIAQQNIGASAIVHNDVTRSIVGNVGALTVGETVYRDELVRTGAESSTKIVFLDSTNLAVGPVSRVVLDRFVFDAEPSSQTMAINLAKGVFRFTTGVMDKGAYSIETPTAGIGVRGTVLDIAVDRAGTRVTLREGKALVCPREQGKTFDELARDCARSKPSAGAAGAARHCDCVELDKRAVAAVARGEWRVAPSLHRPACSSRRFVQRIHAVRGFCSSRK